MSSSSRNSAIAAVACVLAAACAREAVAQTYVVPTVELSSEYHTNRDLNPASSQVDSTMGYIAMAQALIGKRTQRSQTELRPRLRFQEYQNRSGVDPVDFFLDLQSDYRTLTGDYSLLASASRQDTFTAEFGQAGVDTNGPQTPDSHNDTGIVFVGIPRTEFRARPSMEHFFSERISLGASVDYDKVNYQNTAVTTREDYSDVTLQTLLQYEIRPLTRLGIGPYVSRFKGAQSDNRTDSAGMSVDWNHDVSEVSHTEIIVALERTQINDPTFISGRETQTNWRAEFKGYRKGQASRLDYGLGRYLAGSGIGSRVQRNELYLQYTRQLSPRWDYRGAVRGGTEQRLGLSDSARDRDYVRAEFFVRWFMTPTIYISGGYRYAWQKYKVFPNGADDNAALVLFGFRGLDRRRSAVRGAQ